MTAESSVTKNAYRLVGMSFNFEGLPLDIMLRVSDFLPKPVYLVYLQIDCSSTAGQHVPGQRLIYRSFPDELEALRDIYRLNTFDDRQGKCICRHSREVLCSLDTDMEYVKASGSLQSRIECLKSKIAAFNASKGNTSSALRPQFELGYQNAVFRKRGLDWIRALYLIDAEGF